MDDVIDYDVYITDQSRRLFQRYLQGLAVLFLVLGAVLVMATMYHPATRTLADAIVWSDQDEIPNQPENAGQVFSQADTATTVDRLFYEYTQWIEDSPTKEPPTVIVPHDQRIVIVGRHSFGSELQYVLATEDTYSYAQTCIIEDGGELSLIGVDHDQNRALFSYSNPGYKTSPFDEKCFGIEFFFEELRR